MRSFLAAVLLPLAVACGTSPDPDYNPAPTSPAEAEAQIFERGPDVEVPEVAADTTEVDSIGSRR